MAHLYQPHTHTIGPGEGEQLITIHDMGGLTEPEIRQLIETHLTHCGRDGLLPTSLEDEMITDTHYNVVPAIEMGPGMGVPDWKLELCRFMVPFPAEWNSGVLLVSSSTNMHDSQGDHKDATNLRPLTAIHSEILFDGTVLRNQLTGPVDRGEDIFFEMSEQRTVRKATEVVLQYKNSTVTAANAYMNPATHKLDHLINLADDLQPKEDPTTHGWLPDWKHWYAGFGSHNYTAGFYLLYRTS